MGGTHLFELHYVRVHERPVVLDFPLHIFCNLRDHAEMPAPSGDSPAQHQLFDFSFAITATVQSDLLRSTLAG